MSTNFGVFLSKFIEEKNLKLEYIAKKTDSSKPSISLYCKGERIPKDDFVKKFCIAFNISIEKSEEIMRMVLLDRTPQEIKKEIIGLEKKIKQITDKNFKNTEVKFSEKYDQQYSNLGLLVKGHMISNDDRIEAKNYIYEGRTLEDDVHKDCFFIKLDSENIQMPRGGVLLIDPLQRDIENMKIYLIELNGKEYLKRIVLDTKLEGKLILKSLNDKTNDIYRAPDEIKILGRAVKFNYEEDL